MAARRRAQVWQDAPERLHVIRQGMKDEARVRQVSARVNAGQDCRALLVGVEEDVSNRADQFARPCLHICYDVDRTEPFRHAYSPACHRRSRRIYLLIARRAIDCA